MAISYFSIAFIIGITLSILCSTYIGITPGGIVVPAYLAVTACTSPKAFLLIIAMSFVIYAIVNFGVEKFVILYGSRMFTATLVVGVVLKFILEWIFPTVFPYNSVAIHLIGIITPALLANRYIKQKVRYTLPATIIVSYLTFAVTMAIVVMDQKHIPSVVTVIVFSAFMCLVFFGLNKASLIIASKKSEKMNLVKEDA